MERENAIRLLQALIDKGFSYDSVRNGLIRAVALDIGLDDNFAAASAFAEQHGWFRGKSVICGSPVTDE